MGAGPQRPTPAEQRGAPQRPTPEGGGGRGGGAAVGGHVAQLVSAIGAVVNLYEGDNLLLFVYQAVADEK